MKKLIYLIVVIVALSLIIAGCGIPVVPPAEQGELGNLETASISKNGVITIDGVLETSEWGAYHLGTSTTDWGGGMIVNVYGYADDSYLYAAYEVDIPNSPGFATALILGIPPNFYYRTPQTATWPDEGYTIFEMTYPHVMQTDGAGWVVVYPDLASMQAAGIEVGLNTNWWSHNGEAELKIPLSLLTYAGDDGQIRLSGQYWQYEFLSTPFFVAIPPIEVDIDIKPGSDPNSINPNSKGVIPVAILTTPDFDATTVDGTTVRFGPDKAEPAHDLSVQLVLLDHQHDVDGDGDVDFVFHFRTQDTGIVKGQTFATLTGETYGGISIEGMDSVRTVGK